jgi:hypothetical protein
VCGYAPLRAGEVATTGTPSRRSWVPTRMTSDRLMPANLAIQFHPTGHGRPEWPGHRSPHSSNYRLPAHLLMREDPQMDLDDLLGTRRQTPHRWTQRRPRLRPGQDAAGVTAAARPADQGGLSPLNGHPCRMLGRETPAGHSAQTGRGMVNPTMWCDRSGRPPVVQPVPSSAPISRIWSAVRGPCSIAAAFSRT